MACIKIDSIVNHFTLVVVDFDGQKVHDQFTSNLPLLLSLARCDLMKTRGSLYSYFVYTNIGVSAYWQLHVLKGGGNTLCV